MNIEQITVLASVVATEYTASTEAHAAAIEAEALLLERVVEAVRPALRAVSTKRRTSGRTWWPTNVETSTEYTAGSYGLRVCGDGPEYDYPRANAGKYEGCDLFLLPDGSWIEASYTGSWSRWQGAGDSWEATERTLTTAEVAAEYDVDAIIAAIADVLEKAKGSREKSTTRALERAEKIRAIAKLVRS
jgi:hypothetical protein